MDSIEITKSLDEIRKFKGDDLKIKLDMLAEECIGKNAQEIVKQKSLFDAALIVKKASAQIDEVIHALGIINCLPYILQKGEKVESLSLASGTAGCGIDLVTNYRIAEFKFSQGKVGGIRRRKVVADLVSLFLEETTKKKELFVYDVGEVEKCFRSKKSEWRKVLSKEPKLKNRLEKYSDFDGQVLFDIYSIADVEVIDIANILK